MNMGISKKPFKVKGKGPNYYYKVNGARKSLESSDMAEAQRTLNTIRKLYFAGKLSKLAGGPEACQTLREFREEYWEWAVDAIASQSTLRANLLGLDKLIAAAGESTRLDRLTPRHADEMIAQGRRAGLKTGSINNYLRHARAVLNKAVEWRYLQANPLRQSRELPKDKRPPLYIQPEDVTRFLASIQDREQRRLVTAYIYSGRRRGELAALEWSDVAMDREEYFIRRSKAHLSKWYPMHPIFKAVLQAIGPQESGRVFPRWGADRISHIVKGALRGYGLGHLHLHHLRHTFATIALEEGADLASIGDLLGHTDRRATDIYAHVTNTRARAAIRLIKAGPVEL